MNVELDAKEILRNRVLDMTNNLFSTYGIKTITMDEIASSVGISKRTLYELFTDKADLLYASVSRNQEMMREYVDGVLASTDNVLEVIMNCYKYTIKNYHNVNPRFFEDIKKYPLAFHLFTKGQKEDSKKSVDFFNKGVEQGLFRTDVNFEVLNLLLKEQMNVLMNSEVNKLYSMVLIYESITFTFLRGVSTEKGYNELEALVKEYRLEQGKNYLI